MMSDEQVKDQAEAAEAPPEEQPKPAAPKIKVTSYLGEDEFDLSDEEDAARVRELAEQGYTAKRALEEAKKARDAAKTDSEFAANVKNLLNSNPQLRSAFQSVVQTGKFPEGDDDIDSDSVDTSDRRLQADLLEMRRQLQTLHSEIEEGRSQRDQERAEARIDSALDKHASWMKETPELRDTAKAMIALQVSEHDVDPGIATMQVARTLGRALNRDKQKAYDEAKNSDQRTRSVKPNDGNPNVSELPKFKSEDWSTRNRKSTLSKITEILKERHPHLS